jgi:uncharacterized lipoprotein YmbA
MALNVPNTAELIALKALVGHTAQTEDLEVILFTSNITPADTDTAATYTAVEAAGGGYARKTLSAASWNVSANPITCAAQVWTFTGPLTGDATIYGYAVLRATTGDLLWSENFGVSFQPQANNDALTVNLQLGAD